MLAFAQNKIELVGEKIEVVMFGIKLIDRLHQVHNFVQERVEIETQV